MKFYFIFFLAFLNFGCNHSVTTEHYSTTDSITKKTDTSEQHKIINENWEEKGNRLRDTNYQYLSKILDNVLTSAGQHKNDNFFNGIIDTSVYHFKNMYATFQFGNIFSVDRKHLLVKRFIDEYDSYEKTLLSDIYILKNNRFIKLIADTAGIGYYEDTLKDINLDGFKDFIVSQYSHTGCCPRDDKIAYLYNNKNGDFETVGFFNPEFDNTNKLIYEMDYGHPGEVSMEKSKWNKLSKIKIESISPKHFDNRIDSFVKPYSFIKIIYPSQKTITVKDVPEEYKKLKNFEYFLQYQERLCLQPTWLCRNLGMTR